MVLSKVSYTRETKVKEPTIFIIYTNDRLILITRLGRNAEKKRIFRACKCMGEWFILVVKIINVLQCKWSIISPRPWITFKYLYIIV